MEEEELAVIIGAGIAGLATAVALQRVGIRAVVLERSETLRATGSGLALFPNAWLALDALGVAHKLFPLYSPSNRGLITNVPNGTIQEVAMTGPDRGGVGPRIVHRKALLEALEEELPPDSIRFSSKLTSIDVQKFEASSIAILHLDDGTVIKTKILIGCDGVHSVVSRWLGLGKPVSSGRWAVRGLAVYPQGHGFDQEFKQYIDVGKRGGFVPLTDKEIYWFLTTSNSTLKGGNTVAGDPESIRKEVENIVKDFPSTYLDVISHTDHSTLTSAPLMMRFPWDVLLGNISKGTITVAGDALHPMTPDLGQGGCSSLEDAVVLGRHIGESFIKHGQLMPREVAIAINKYVKERRWRAAWLITSSYISGWAQQSGSNWWTRFFRDVIFYRFLYRRIFSVMKYDCGKLPSA